MNLTERAKNMIIRPGLEWNLIKNEPADTHKIITGYVLPLAAAAAIAAFIGYAFIGFGIMGYRMKGIDWGLYQAVNIFITALLSIFVTAMVIDALAPSFGSEKNFGRSVQLVAYAYTPALLGGLLAVVPALSVIGSLFGLYGLYLLYIGLPKLKGTPADRQVAYFIISLIVTLVVYVVIGMILGRILMAVFGLSYGGIVGY